MDKKIMVVDDDPDILITIRMIFENEKYEVFTVDSGKDCIHEIENGFKGIVLMDIIMPFMDGLDTIKEIVDKKLMKNIIISILSAKHVSNQTRIRGFKPYIQDYISKPFDVEKLIIDIKKYDNL